MRQVFKRISAIQGRNTVLGGKMGFTARQICQLLDMPEQVLELTERFESSFSYENVQQELMELTIFDRWEAARESLKQKLGADRDGIGMLACMLHSMEYSHAYYIEEKIPEQIFVDTMKCFTRFVGEHFVSYGRYGFDRDFWTGRQLSGVLFRIGELEYELTQKEIPVTGDEMMQENVISIHIPSDAVLTEENCRKSFDGADLFFREHFPQRAGDKYICNSWLLSPALRGMLGTDSNIIRFQKLFEIVSWEQESKEFLEWVFKRRDIGFHELPEHTSLQRKMKAYLQKGGKVGEALGVRNMK